MLSYLSEQTTQSNAHIGSLQGLSESKVRERHTNGEGNMTPLKTSRSYFQIVRENVFTPINTTLFALGIVLIMLGQISDALVSVSVVFINVLVISEPTVRMHVANILSKLHLADRTQAAIYALQQHVVPLSDALEET
jgi:cation-transporting ATPase E